MFAACLIADATAEGDFRNWRALRDEGVVRQSLDYSCGAAALATLLNRYRASHLTERELLEVLASPPPGLGLPQGWRDSGMSFATLVALAQHYGFTAVGVELAAADLKRLRVPAWAYLPNSDPPHFSTITGVDPRGSVELADPSWGNRRMRLQRFNRLWLDAGTGRGRLLVVRPRAPGAAMPALALQRVYPLLRATHWRHR